MTLSHYTPARLGELYSFPPEQQADALAFKPHGLWVSVDGPRDWREWCIENEFGLDRMVYRYEVLLAPDANVLTLPDADAIARFEAEFGVTRKVYEFLDRPDTIDWVEVARRYKGILIAPYSWPHRLGSLWYYGWDCASGCIWDHTAIAKVVLDTTWKPPTEEA